MFLSGFVLSVFGGHVIASTSFAFFLSKYVQRDGRDGGGVQEALGV